jgi:serine/threonine protein kinase
MPTAPLQRYYIMEPLGTGGQASTYRAIDRDTDRPVAVKVVSLRKLRQWKTFDLFEREVAVLRSLDHPGIPAYIDSYASEATGDYFLVMELIEGQSLRDLMLAGRRFSPTQLREIFDQILDILAYLHGLNPAVVHRDIKPANLVMTPKGRVCLVDFGGVRRAMRPEGGSTMIGTFGYMAPEQLHGTATPSSDVYALGATMAALCTGTEAEALPREGLAVDVAALDVPPWLRTVLVRMLAPDPRDRFASVEDVRSALRRAAPEPSHPPGRERKEAKALVHVSSTMRSLAEIRAPISVLVWIVMALGAGALTVVEAIMLPILYRVFGRYHARRSDEETRKGFEDEYSRLRRSIRRQREAMSWVADKTHPIRD